MTLVVFAGGKHSPGASTLAAAFAATCAGSVIEADPAGGDLAFRAGISVGPGLVSLAAAARSTLTRAMLTEHAQQLGSGIRLVAGPVTPRLAATTVQALAGPLAHVLAEDSADVVAVDVGRFDDPRVMAPLLEAADRRVLVLRATAEDVASGRDRLAELTGFGPVTVAVVERGPYSIREIAAVLDAPVDAIAFDPRAATMLSAGRPLTGWLARSPLLRSARQLHNAVCTEQERVA